MYLQRPFLLITLLAAAALCSTSAMAQDLSYHAKGKFRSVVINQTPLGDNNPYKAENMMVEYDEEGRVVLIKTAKSERRFTYDEDGYLGREVRKDANGTHTYDYLYSQFDKNKNWLVREATVDAGTPNECYIMENRKLTYSDGMTAGRAKSVNSIIAEKVALLPYGGMKGDVEFTMTKLTTADEDGEQTIWVSSTYRQYDDSGRLLKEATTDPNDVTVETLYEWTGDGTVESITKNGVTYEGARTDNAFTYTGPDGGMAMRKTYKGATCTTETAGGESYVETFDADGRVVKKVKGNETTTYYYKKGDLLEEMTKDDTGKLISRYVYVYGPRDAEGNWTSRGVKLATEEGIVLKASEETRKIGYR